MTDATRGCCESFARAEALRRRDLPGGARTAREWDRGMPAPAGTGVDRRRFLLGAAGGLVAVYGAGRLGLTDRVLQEGIAQAAGDQGASSPIFVSIFVPGGMDALSLLAPLGDPLYQKYRPTLAIAPDGTIPFTEDPRLHWHPAAAPLAGLHGAGKVTVIPGIGYSGPDMSHFNSRHYWEVGVTDTHVQTGWLGRYLDRAGTTQNPLQGLSMDGQSNPALATQRNPVAAIDTPEDYSLWVQNVWSDIFGDLLRSMTDLGTVQRTLHDPALAQVAAAASEAGVLRRSLAPLRTADGSAAFTSPVTYPTTSTGDLPQRLAGLAAMIAAGLPLRCVALTTDTQIDTHSDQPKLFGPAVQLIAASIAAFQADLEARGLADRVLIHLWSEFGRRAQENGSTGTDHGASGTSLLIGTRTRGTMVGEWPGLSTLDTNGNLIENVDFRGVYCSLIEQWFGSDAVAVIPGAAQFSRYPLVR